MFPFQLLRCLASGPSGQMSGSGTGASSVGVHFPSALSHPLPGQSLPAPAAVQGTLTAGSTSASAESASALIAHDAASTPAPQWIDSRAQISSDSLVEGFTRIGERTTVKRSVVGRGCVVGKNVKLTGTIVMEGVRIGDK